MRLIGVTALLAVLLSGCSMIPFVGSKKPPRRSDDIASVLAQLPELELPSAVAAAPTQAEVMDAYERVYGLIPDARENRSVGKRLADLKMSVGEDRDIAGVEAPYDDAVALYESLLLDEASEGQDQILYQLARAYDVVGNTEQAVMYLDRLISEHPQSDYTAEAHFRRAEIAFSREQYAAAARDYRYVVDLGPSPYWQNATYMLGWSNFKQNDLEAGLVSFFMVIDALLADTEAADLAATDRELLTDSLRVVTLALAYLDGPDTLADQMRQLGQPDWQFAVYDALARAYVEDERFLDSVNTWQRFIEENSLDARAPNAHIGMIDTLIGADFPSEIRPKKAQFVRRYGITSEFWIVHDAATRDSYSATLREYLIELAEVAHGNAQTSGQPADFVAAANWYEEIVATFPDDPATAEYVFLLGEVYTEAGEPGKAVAAYQRVVREFADFPKANEAGYAAILGLAELVASAPADELELWQRLKIDAQIEFALTFPGDQRAPVAQLDAADTLFGLGQYPEALDLAQNLFLQWPDVEPALRKPALLILGHGWFELQDFVAAESAYRDALALQLAADEQAKVNERLLAAVFKQAEASEAAGAGGDAIYHYLRVGDIDPGSELAIQGHFDAVAVLESEGRTGEARGAAERVSPQVPGP